MGFASIDDFLNKVTNNAQFFRQDWTKQTGGSAYTIGRWYDMTTLGGYPSQMVYGDMLTNGITSCAQASVQTNVTGWTLGAHWFTGPGTAAGPLNTIYKTSGGSNTLVSSFTPASTGNYLVTWTLSGTFVGNFTVSMGGATGTARSAAGTYYETLAVVNTTSPLTITPSATSSTGAVSAVSVVKQLYSYALTDTMPSGAMYTGGNVSPATKHIANAGIVAASSYCPGMWVLCDMLLAYPGINANTASAQALTTTATLPRYTDGKGVRAFVVPNTVLGATVQNIAFSYTNTTPASGRTLPVTVTGLPAAIVGHIYHSGVTANAYGPFLPLAAGDVGITSLDQITLSAAGGTTNTWLTAVLCKPLATLPVTTVGMLSERDFLNQLPSFPRVYDGAVLGWLYYAGVATAANSNAHGFIDFVYG